MSKKKMKVTIVDYGINNTRSVVNALRLLDVKSFVTSNVHDMKQSDAIILPGVGAFGQAIFAAELIILFFVISVQNPRTSFGSPALR